jgi:hypothetical protein
MKKVLVLFLSAMLVMAFATVSWAAITTTGEIDLDYFAHKKDYADKTTLAEIGLYNEISINDTTSAYIGLWMETNKNNEQGYSDIDDVYVTKKMGVGSLKVGYGRYNIDGPLDVLGNGNFAMYLLGGSLEPAVQLLYTAPVNEAVTAKAGYFYDWSGDTADKGRDAYSLQASYAKGPLFADVTYLGIGKGDIDTVDPSDEYIIDGGYKIGENYTIYAALLGANMGVSGTDSNDITDTKAFGLLGAAVTAGNFFFEVESVVSTPSDWHKNADGDDANPFGFMVDYKLDKNSKLRFARAINTNGLADFTKAQYIICF